MVKDQPREIQLRTFDLVKLTKVDVIEQFFKVQFFCTFAFPNGAKDEDLMKMDKDDQGKYKFGFGEDGKPNWLPSAGWFMDQFDTNNGIDWTFLDKAVMVDGDDIVIKLRIEGTFYERLELEDFPYDVQDLTMSLAVNTRTTGMTPVTLTVAENPTLGIDMEDGFQLSQFYNIETLKTDDGKPVLDHKGLPIGKVHVSCYEVGTSADRMFPSIGFTIKILRRPAYYVLNVTVPLCIFNLLAFMQFAVDPVYIADRLSISLTLVLTTAAYKFAVASLVPALSYMTLLDEYVLANWMTIVLVSFAGGTVGLLTDEDFDSVDDDETSGAGRMLIARNRGAAGNYARDTDAKAAGAIAIFWICLQIYYAHRIVIAQKSTWKETFAHWGQLISDKVTGLKGSSYSSLDA